MKTRTNVILYILLTAFLFGSMEVALKLASAGFDGFQITFLRFAIGGLLLLPLGLGHQKREQIHLTLKDHLWLALLGILCIPVSMMLFQMGVEHSNAATAAVLFCINPLFTMLLAAAFAGEKMTSRKWAAFAISLVALVFMMRPWDLQEGNTVLGFCYSLTGALAFSAYTVAGKKSLPKLGNFLQTSLSFLYGSLVMLVVLIILDKPILAGTVENLPLLLYVGVMVTGVGYFAYFQAIKYSDATTGSVAFLIKPVIAPFLALLILRESLLWNTLLGMVLLVGASLINFSENKKPSHE